MLLRAGASFVRHHAVRRRHSPSPSRKSQPPSRRCMISGAPTDNYAIKCTAFWFEKIETDRFRPVQLWESVDKLLGRGRRPTRACSSLDVESLNDFFVEKVSKVRGATTCGASTPTFSTVCDGVSLPHFSTISIDDVIRSTRQLLDKSSAADLLPTYIFKQVIDLLAPFVTELFNCSLAAGCFPSSFKVASITPVLKKQGLNPADASSYRPISNLSVLSKLLERFVAQQLQRYLFICVCYSVQCYGIHMFPVVFVMVL